MCLIANEQIAGVGALEPLGVQAERLIADNEQLGWAPRGEELVDRGDDVLSGRLTQGKRPYTTLQLRFKMDEVSRAAYAREGSRHASFDCRSLRSRYVLGSFSATSQGLLECGRKCYAVGV